MFLRRKREEDLDRELRSHLDLEAEEQKSQGVPDIQARYAAHRAFGNVTAKKSQLCCHFHPDVSAGNRRKHGGFHGCRVGDTEAALLPE